MDHKLFDLIVIIITHVWVIIFLWVSIVLVCSLKHQTMITSIFVIKIFCH